MKQCLQLFIIFSKIGLFTLGGGYAMLPLIESEITDKRNWISKRDFLDLTALSQAAPGIFAVNMAIFVGYKLCGLRGAICAALGTVMPSFVIILLVALFFHHYRENQIIERIFKGIRPVVIALIAVPVFRLGKSAGITWKTVWFPIVCALLVWLGHISPVYIVLMAGLCGWLFCRGVRA